MCRRENMSCVPDPLGCGYTAHPQHTWTCGWSLMPWTRVSPHTAPHGCSHEKSNSHPREERLCLGTPCLSISLTFLLPHPNLPVSPTWQLGPGSCCCLSQPAPCSLSPICPSNPVLCPIAPVWSIAWVFGDEVASPSFSRLRGYWHAPGAGLLAVLRGRAKTGGARGEQEKMLEQIWETVGSLCAARTCSAFLLVFAQLNRFCCCCCCCHENPTKSCSFPEVEVAFSFPEDTSERGGHSHIFA